LPGARTRRNRSSRRQQITPFGVAASPLPNDDQAAQIGSARVINPGFV
jgi:hypothetical protein